VRAEVRVALKVGVRVKGRIKGRIGKETHRFGLGLGKRPTSSPGAIMVNESSVGATPALWGLKPKKYNGQVRN
jgi:hypothetical protein